MKTQKDRIVRQIEIKAPIAKVWDALTDYQKFGEWFRVKIDGPFVVGELSVGHMTYPGFEGYKWEAVIQKMNRDTYFFSYTWPSGAEQGDDETQDNWTLVEFQLEEVPSGTLLTVIETGFDKVPSNRRAAAFRDNSGGWSIQVKNIQEYVENKKSSAVSFLKMVASGKAKDAYAAFVSPNFIHHNQYFKGDRQSLMTAMEEASKNNPNKTIDIKHVFQDGETVITLSHVKQNPEDSGGAVVHIFRFENGRVAELWDLGQRIIQESPNENGPF